MYVYVCVCVSYACIYMYIRMCVYIYILFTSIHLCISKYYVCVCIHTHVYAHIHTCMYTDKIFFLDTCTTMLKKTSWMHNRCKNRLETVGIDHN